MGRRPGDSNEPNSLHELIDTKLLSPLLVCIYHCCRSDEVEFTCAQKSKKCMVIMALFVEDPKFLEIFAELVEDALLFVLNGVVV